MSIDWLMTEGPLEKRRDKGARSRAADRGDWPAVKMNSQQNRVNDYRVLSRAVIDLRLAWVFMFIDAIVYLFGAQRLL